MMSHGDWVGKPPKDLNDISFVAGHFGYAYVQKLIPKRYSFTFLRNPKERILSFYFFGKSRNPEQYPIYQICHDLCLEDFLRAGLADPIVRQYIWNHQTWQLACGWRNPEDIKPTKPVEGFISSDSFSILEQYREEQLLSDAIKHLDQFSYVGFTETFEHDKDIILKKLGLPATSKKLTENMTPNRPKSTSLSPTENALIEDLTKLDQALYQYAWRKHHPSKELPLDV